MANKKTNEKWKGVIRHFLSLIGGILITLGIIGAEEVDILTTALVEAVGAILVIWSVLASIFNKDKNIKDDDNGDA